jgi:hypothetical protein
MLLAQIINREKLQKLVSYTSPYIDYINCILDKPVHTFWDRLALRKEYVPPQMTVPLNLIGVIIFVIWYVMVYGANLFCYLFGVVYPIVHSRSIISRQTSSSADLTIVTKYWILFSSFTMMETIFGFLLYYIPIYPYLKLITIYFMVSNDFSNTILVYSKIGEQIENMDEKFQIISYITNLKFLS